MHRMSTQGYQKAKSIVGIRQQPKDFAEVYRKIERLRRRMSAAGKSNYQSRIVLKACSDVLVASSADSPERFSLQDFTLEELTSVSDNDLARYLFYRYRYEMYPRRHIVDDFPPCLQVEPSSVCNYRCVFCYQSDEDFRGAMAGHMGFMNLNLFKRIIDQAAGRCEAVTLASRGEPLLCPDIEEMLAYLRGKFLASKVNTNASLLDERKCHAILQAGIGLVVFSVDASTEPLYRSLRKNGHFERVRRNIERFQEIRRRHYPRAQTITRISGVRYSAEQDLNQMEQFWGELVDQVVFVECVPWKDSYRRPDNEIVDPCSELWLRMFIWHDGTVNPCEFDYKSTMAVGNVATAPLSDIWTSEDYGRLRDAHLTAGRAEIPLCRRCTFV